MSVALGKKERNYTIEFVRFTFALNFILCHCLQIFPLGYLGFTASAALGTYIYESALDTIMPFIVFAGYFMMESFMRKERTGQNEGIAPCYQATRYLGGRLKSLLPMFMLAMLLGAIGNGIWRGYTLAQYPEYLLACVGEFFGLQLSGLGMGNGFVGVWGSVPAPIKILCNTPLWFVSGLFICGFIVYYGLAKNRKAFLGIIVPVISVLFYGSCAATNTNPLWNTFIVLGGISINASLINMFCGLGIGCLLWVAVDKLKDMKFTTFGKVVLAVFAVISWAIVMIRTWASANSDFMKNWFNIGWAATYLFSFIFCFLVLLNKDCIDRCKIWNNKIWKWPGRLALYMYMFHFPVLLFTGYAFGMNGMNKAIGVIELPNGVKLNGLDPATIQVLVKVVILTYIITIVLSVALFLLDTKVIQPWLSKNPFVKKEELTEQAFENK